MSLTPKCFRKRWSVYRGTVKENNDLRPHRRPKFPKCIVPGAMRWVKTNPFTANGVREAKRGGEVCNAGRVGSNHKGQAICKGWPNPPIWINVQHLVCGGKKITSSFSKFYSDKPPFCMLQVLPKFLAWKQHAWRPSAVCHRCDNNLSPSTHWKWWHSSDLPPWTNRWQGQPAHTLHKPSISHPWEKETHRLTSSSERG